MTIAPDFQSFEKTFKAGQSQLVWQWLPADLETPVSAFLKLAHGEPYALLLESVEGGAVLGRYSAIGLKPDLIWTCTGGRAALEQDGKAEPQGDPMKSLREIVGESRIDHVPETIPPMGPSGLFGYMGYGMVGLMEDIPDANPDPLGIPDSILIRPTVMVIFDNVQSMMCLVTPARETKGPARKAYDEACARLYEVKARLARPAPAHDAATSHKAGEALPIRSNMSREDFHGIVRKAVEYIEAGEIFQAVLSQRFSIPFDLPPFALYRSLRRLNPSPFLFFLQLGGFALVGSSPEIMVRVREGIVTIRPIAGTRKRGATAAEDKALAADLLADPKERAEHLMLLDLGRNDVGRVAQTGSVAVTEQFAIENYSHVMHIVSNVEGKLRADHDALDALFAGFPAGTVSGAPKVRAMQIIDELETLRRSFYAGCIGYLDGGGDLDSCIALRTALVKDGTLTVQAGAGIVADSDPEAEYQETCNKARAIIQAAEQALALASEEQLQAVPAKSRTTAS